MKAEDGGPKPDRGRQDYETTGLQDDRRQKADFPSTNYSIAEECGGSLIRAIRGSIAFVFFVVKFREPGFARAARRAVFPSQALDTRYPPTSLLV